MGDRIIQQDEFGYAPGTLVSVAANWTEYDLTPSGAGPSLFGHFRVDGDGVRPDHEFTLPGYNARTNLALYHTFDPGASSVVVPGGQAQGQFIRLKTQALITMPSPLPAGQNYEAYVVVRSASNPLSAGSEAYLFGVEHDTSGTQYLRLKKLNANGTVVLISSFTLGGTYTPAMAAGESATFEASIFATNTAVHELHCWRRNFGATPAGLFAVINGNINSVGKYSGIYCRQTGPRSGQWLTSRFTFDNFRVLDARGVSANGPVQEFNPIPQLSTAVSGLSLVITETEDPSPHTLDALPVGPAYALPQTPRYETREFRPDDQVSLVTHAKTTDSRPMWDLVFGPLTSSERTALRDFFEDVSTVKPFTFTHPETGDAVRCRVIPNSGASFEQIGPAHWTARCAVEELFTLSALGPI